MDLFTPAKASKYINTPISSIPLCFLIPQETCLGILESWLVFLMMSNENFSDPRFHLFILFFWSVELDKVPKRCLNALTFNPRFDQGMCPEVGRLSLETFKQLFYNFLAGFLEIDVIFSIFEDICKKDFFPKIFRSEFQRKIYFFWRKFSSSTSSSSQTECRFDNSLENFSAKVRKFLARNPRKKIMKLLCFQWKHLSSKPSSGHVECRFDNPIENFLSNIQFFLLAVQKMINFCFF